jgi:hypothetical protein
MEADQGGHVKVGENIPIYNHKCLVNVRCPGGKPDGAGGVEKFRLDRIKQANPCHLPIGVGSQEGIRAIAERKNRFRNPGVGQLSQDSFEHPNPGYRKELLRSCLGERTETSSLTSDKDNRSHFFVDASVVGVVEAGAVVVAVVAVVGPVTGKVVEVDVPLAAAVTAFKRAVMDVAEGFGMVEPAGTKATVISCSSSRRNDPGSPLTREEVPNAELPPVNGHTRTCTSPVLPASGVPFEHLSPL